MLKDKVVFITGGSRGIGEAIALKCAQAGAHIAIAAKTAEPHPLLPGTIYTVAEKVRELGRECLPLHVDARNDVVLAQAVATAADFFGGIDVLINNCSAIQLTNTPNTLIKRYDLMQTVNARATFVASQACLPYLTNAENPHILTLSPPLHMNPRWFKDHLAYTMSKYGMSMCTLGMAAEFSDQGIAVNSLWPRTTIATAAIEVHFPEEMLRASRKPDIVADAALHILQQPSGTTSGHFFIDEEVLREAGISDFSCYAVDPSVQPQIDLFLDE